MLFYTLDDYNPSRLYVWETEDSPIVLNILNNKKSCLYWYFEELRNYPNKQVVFARALLPHSFTTGFRANEINLINFNNLNPNNDLGLIALWNDEWYKVIGEKPVKIFYVKKHEQSYFYHLSKENKLNEFIKYEYRGN